MQGWWCIVDHLSCLPDRAYADSQNTEAVSDAPAIYLPDSLLETS